MNSKFSARLKELRIQRNLKQRELGEIMGCSQVTIARWESGERNPGISDILKLAEFFDVTTDYLLGAKDL